MIVVLEIGIIRTSPVETEVAKYPEILFYVFEPRPHEAPRFDNLGLKNLVFVPKAVWNKNEMRTMFIGGKGDAASSLTHDRGCKYYPPITVECIDFDQWTRANLNCDDYNVIRADIEGSEFVVLPHLIDKGSIDYFKEIQIEWHRRKFVGTRIYLEKIFTYCESHNIHNENFVSFSLEGIIQRTKLG